MGVERAWADSVIKTIPVGMIPFGVAFDSNNGNIYVTNQASNTVSVIDGSTNTVIKTIPVGGGPSGVAFDSNNGNIYVANRVANTVSVIHRFRYAHDQRRRHDYNLVAMMKTHMLAQVFVYAPYAEPQNVTCAADITIV